MGAFKAFHLQKGFQVYLIFAFDTSGMGSYIMQGIYCADYTDTENQNSGHAAGNICQSVCCSIVFPYSEQQ